MKQHPYDLAAALKEMVRGGMKPHLVAVRAAFAALLGIEAVVVEAPMSQRVRVGGTIMTEFLRRLDSLQGTYLFDGEMRTATQIKVAALVLLRLVESTPLPNERRRKAMALFGIYVEPSTWSHRLEHEFFALLANAIAEQDRDVAA